MNTPILLSQRDPHWAGVRVGTSSLTIADIGCTITCIAMKLGLDPVIVNDRLNALPKNDQGFTGYAYDNLVLWTRLGEAFPGIKFEYKYTPYDNKKALDNVPCLVEVDAKPIGGTRHWVLYVGNQQLYDPLDGKVKPTTTYAPLSVVVLSGEYKTDKPTSSLINTYGLDLTNTKSMQVVFDTWHDVASGKYVLKSEYDALVEKAGQLNTTVESIDPGQSEAAKRYAEFVRMGYNKVEDVTNAIKNANKKVIDLLQDQVVILKQNELLANSIASDAKNSYTAVETALAETGKVQELQESIAQIAKVTGAKKPSVNEIVSNILNVKSLADRFMKEKEKGSTSSSPSVKSEVKPVKTDSPSLLSRFFTNLNSLSAVLQSDGEGVSK